MMEVFVAYIHPPDVDALEQALEAWDIDGLEPVAVEVKHRKFELGRRVMAENVSLGDYILAGLNCGPVEENFAELAVKALAENPRAGLIKVKPIADDWVSGRVTICRKGVIKHWIQAKGSQEADVLWTNAHEESCRFAGYEVIECDLMHYQLLAASSPS